MLLIYELKINIGYSNQNRQCSAHLNVSILPSLILVRLEFVDDPQEFVLECIVSLLKLAVGVEEAVVLGLPLRHHVLARVRRRLQLTHVS